MWYCGPLAYQAAGAATVGWPVANAAVAGGTQQALTVAATGASGAAGATQPYLPAGFWSKIGQHAIMKLHGVLTLPVTATTVTWAVGSAATPQSTATTITATNTFFTSSAYSNSSVVQTNVPWHFELDMSCTKVGIGTTAVSTSVLTTGFGGYTPAIVAAVGSVPTFGPVAGNVITTFDASINQYIWVSVAFSTNSATNTCALTSLYVYGMN